MKRADRTIISNRLSAVSIRDLVLVSTVWKRSSFRTVARELGISPSGLSHQVRKVEDALATTLFERSSQNVKATPEGILLLSHIEQVLREVGALDLLATKTAMPFGGHFKLGVISALGPYIMPHFVALFEAIFPTITLDFLEGKTEGVTQRLRGGEIDMMLSCRKDDGRDFETRKLFAERLDLIVNTAHPIANVNMVTMQELASLDIMTMADGEGYSEDTTVPPPAQNGDGIYGPTSEIRGLSFETIGALISTRGGMSLVPALSVPRLAAFPNVRIIRIDGNAPMRKIYASWRSSSPHHQAFHQLCDALSKLQDVCDRPQAA